MDNETQIYIEKCLANMDESKRNLTRPILEQYVWLTTMIRKLQDQVDEEGMLVETMKGRKGFEHLEYEEHPAIKTIHKLTPDAGGHYAKLMRYLSKAEMDKVDELDEFLRTNG